MKTPLDAFWMPFTPNRQFKAKPRLVADAHGIVYVTPEGREVLDGISGLWCVGAGHRHPRIDAALVSGYFGPRERLWEEPIYRNLLGVLRDFGDAELARLSASGRVWRALTPVQRAALMDATMRTFLARMDAIAEATALLRGTGDMGVGEDYASLVPVVMALSYTRWNLLYADEYGLALELLPMLAGFFTYKLAVIARQGLELFAEMSGSGGEKKGEGEDGGDGPPKLTQDPLREGYVSESMTLDRIFVKRVIKEM